MRNIVEVQLCPSNKEKNVVCPSNKEKNVVLGSRQQSLWPGLAPGYDLGQDMNLSET